MEAIPTNRWTSKVDTFPTDGRTIHKNIADQQFDTNYADQRSVGGSDFYRPTSVGNPVMWCSDCLFYVFIFWKASRKKKNSLEGAFPLEATPRAIHHV
jgi:hypothetical protein